MVTYRGRIMRTEEEGGEKTHTPPPSSYKPSHNPQLNYIRTRTPTPTHLSYPPTQFHPPTPTPQVRHLKKVRDGGRDREVRLAGTCSWGHVLRQSCWLQARKRPYTTAGRTKMSRAGPARSMKHLILSVCVCACVCVCVCVFVSARVLVI